MNSNYLPCKRQGAQMIPAPAPGYMMTTPTGAAPGMIPYFPTGMPTGPSYAPSPVTVDVTEVQAPPGEQAPQTLAGVLYTPGYLKTQLGRKVRVEFLIGTNGMTDRLGTLVGVGVSYILIQPEESDDIMLCDMYSIKFVTFYY